MTPLPVVPVLLLALTAFSLAAAQGACDGDCAGTYDKCIGRDILSLKNCCDPADECVKFSKWYGQCRPTSDPRFDEDWLGVAVDCRDCGVETKQVGEFNFATSIYCELVFLGSYTLADCAAACASGPYVACDRFIDDPANPTSCYGYQELFEGGCYTRNPTDFYESWLTCRDGSSVGILEGGSDEAPAELSAETLEADIAADEAASTDGAITQRQQDVAAARNR